MMRQPVIHHGQLCHQPRLAGYSAHRVAFQQRFTCSLIKNKNGKKSWIICVFVDIQQSCCVDTVASFESATICGTHLKWLESNSKCRPLTWTGARLLSLQVNGSIWRNAKHSPSHLPFWKRNCAFGIEQLVEQLDSQTTIYRRIPFTPFKKIWPIRVFKNRKEPIQLSSLNGFIVVHFCQKCTMGKQCSHNCSYNSRH